MLKKEWKDGETVIQADAVGSAVRGVTSGWMDEENSWDWLCYAAFWPAARYTNNTSNTPHTQNDVRVAVSLTSVLVSLNPTLPKQPHVSKPEMSYLC